MCVTYLVVCAVMLISIREQWLYEALSTSVIPERSILSLRFLLSVHWIASQQPDFHKDRILRGRKCTTPPKRPREVTGEEKKKNQLVGNNAIIL